MAQQKWRTRRPFWGAIVTMISGLLILWIPMNLYLSAFLPGSLAVIGLLFGGLITLIGILALFFPTSSKLLGVFTIFLSILSVIGALGGFLIGTIVGIIGGSLLIAWRMTPINKKEKMAAEYSETAVQTG